MGIPYQISVCGGLAADPPRTRETVASPTVTAI